MVTDQDFRLTGGCGDVFTYAATDDGRLAVVVQWEGAATAAWEEGAFSASVSLPDDSMAVSLEAGRGLSSFYCNDILMPGQGVQATTKAVAGSVELSVRPKAGGFRPAATADVTLLDIVFEVNTGDEVEIWRLDRLELRDVSVGWFAG